MTTYADLHGWHDRGAIHRHVLGTYDLRLLTSHVETHLDRVLEFARP